MTGRQYFHDYLLRMHPSWSQAAALGEELLDYLDLFAVDATAAIPKRFTFPCTEDIAFAADSTSEAVWGESNDMVHPSAYFRVLTPGGVGRGPMQSVHFYACFKGRLAGFYRSHRVIVMTVKAEDFHIAETF